MENTIVEVGSPLDWVLVPVDSNKRIYSSFDGCFIPFYECLFTQLNFRLPFNGFEVGVLKHMKITPSELHQNA